MKLTKEIKAELNKLLAEKDELIKQIKPAAQKLNELDKKFNGLTEERQRLYQQRKAIGEIGGLSEMTFEELEGILNDRPNTFEQKIKNIEEKIKVMNALIIKVKDEIRPISAKAYSIVERIKLLKKTAFTDRKNEIIEEIKAIAFAFDDEFYDPLTPNWRIRNSFSHTDEARELFYDAHPEFKELLEVANGVRNELVGLGIAQYL